MFLSNRHFISALLALAIGLWLPGSVLAGPTRNARSALPLPIAILQITVSAICASPPPTANGITAFASPSRAGPAPDGYPTVYFLDGNAVLMGLNPALLAKLAAAKRPPVLVMIGYDNDLRIDAAGRAYDYTLPLPAGLKQPPRSAGRGCVPAID